MTENHPGDSAYDLPLDGERFVPVFEGDIVAEHYHRYLLARQFVTGRRVLDIACGEGYGSHLMAGTAEYVTGVDIDRDAVAHARREYVRANLEYRQGDCAAIPLPDASVDVVVSFETIEHHDRHEDMMREIKRVLRPGGLLVMSSPDKLHYSDIPGLTNPFHVRELYRDEFEALLARHFAGHVLLGQRMLYASAIVDGAANGLLTYATPREPGSRELPEAVYLVALASDGPLPQAGSSLLLHDVAASDAVRERERLLQEGRAHAEQQLQEAHVRAGAELEQVRTQASALLEAAASEHAEQLDDLRREGEQRLSMAETCASQLDHALGSQTQQLALLTNRTLQWRWLLPQLLRAARRQAGRRRRYRQERARIEQSGVFDAQWYLERNPDVQASGQDPLRHFVLHGAYEGRSPSEHFDCLAWLKSRPWLLEQHRNPVLDFLDHQGARRAGQAAAVGDATRVYDQLWASAARPSQTHVPLSAHALTEPSRIRAIAFYLPQFHPFEENDRWWGKGFTEWTNVSKALPQFEGHYQPHLPGELGFYDLRLPEVQERQVELAKQYGLAAFCFHYYWFSGRKRLLERPLDQYVANRNIDFPFCICWANENWTRRWDGQENDILMEQRHDPEDDLQFIEDVAPLLRDPRYVRVDGKPLLIVYRITLLPDPVRTAEVWRQYCREQGIGEIHLVVAQSFNIGDPRPFGFDAAVEFPPHSVPLPSINDQVAKVNPEFAGSVHEYSDLVRIQLRRPEPDYLLYRGVFPSWDNEARKPGRGNIFAHASPDLYRQWLGGVCDQTDERADAEHKLVFINAWNEWAEGAHLEPDRRYGYAWLEATQLTLAHFPGGPGADYAVARARLSQAVRRHDTAVVLHLFYPELWTEFVQYLAHLKGEYDLYVTLPEGADEADYAQVLADEPGACLVPCPNRGRDVAPFLLVARALRDLGYGQVCKLHSKKSLHREDGDQWRKSFVGRLLGETAAQAVAIRDAFRNDPGLGLVGPAGHWLDYKRYWGYPNSRPAHFRKVAEQVGVTADVMARLHFFAGSMFWCRPEALGAVLDGIDLAEFDFELGQKDATLAHVLERLFAAVVLSAGLRVSDTDDLQAPPRPAVNYAYAAPSPSVEQTLVVQGGGHRPPGAAPRVRSAWEQDLRERAKRIPLVRKTWEALKQ